ncbi:MAG: pyridoxal-dependent decarboxylase [Pseudomonadota bacterium]
MSNDFDQFRLGDSSANEMQRGMTRLTRYIIDLPNRPVKDSWQDGQLLEEAGGLPEQGEPIEQTLDFFDRAIAPGMLPWNNPGFMGFFGTSAPFPAIAANILTTAHNSNRMVNAANPIASELDELAGEWFRKFLNVPDSFASQLFYSASQSHMHVLASTVNTRTKGLYRRGGIAATGQQFRIYKSQQAHFFVDKNAIAVGIGVGNVVDIKTDANGAMDPAALAQSIEADLANGYQPLMVVATVGTTSSNAVDPVPAIANLCDQFDLFLYVDAAYAGAFASLPEYRWITDGWERADAICINPHKQLMTPLGCSLLFLKDREALRRTFVHGGAYIPDHPEDRPDPMDYTALCGMPMNSLALIFLMRTFGASGLRARLRNTLRLTKLFADMLRADPIFEIIAPHPFTTICFRAKPALELDNSIIDDFNARLARHVMDDADVFLSPTKLDGRTALRLTIGNINTRSENVLSAFRALRRSARTVGGFLSYKMTAPKTGRESFWERHGDDFLDADNDIGFEPAA